MAMLDLSWPELSAAPSDREGRVARTGRIREDLKRILVSLRSMKC